MFKKMMLVAMAAVTACALAQDGRWEEQNRTEVGASGKSQWDIKCAVLRQDQYLTGGDAYTFEAGLNRMDGNVENALISGLFAAHRQSVLLRDQIIASQFPSDTDILAATTGNDSSILAEETETSMRPMRMVMVEHKHRDIDYETAWNILSADLNETQKTLLAKWWDDTDSTRLAEFDSDRTVRMKDIICRLLELDAKRADDPIYPSLYIHHTYAVVPIN